MSIRRMKRLPAVLRQPRRDAPAEIRARPALPQAVAGAVEARWRASSRARSRRRAAPLPQTPRGVQAVALRVRRPRLPQVGVDAGVAGIRARPAVPQAG